MTPPHLKPPHLKRPHLKLPQAPSNSQHLVQVAHIASPASPASHCLTSLTLPDKTLTSTRSNSLKLKGIMPTHPTRSGRALPLSRTASLSHCLSLPCPHHTLPLTHSNVYAHTRCVSAQCVGAARGRRGAERGQGREDEQGQWQKEGKREGREAFHLKRLMQASHLNGIGVRLVSSQRQDTNHRAQRAQRRGRRGRKERTRARRAAQRGHERGHERGGRNRRISR